MTQSEIKTLAKQMVKKAAQQTLGRLPPNSSRLTGKLAIHGGKPVRHTRLRPWPGINDISLLRWTTQMRPAFRKIFLSGCEGRPHSLAQEFARRFAEYSGSRHGLLLGHGTDALRVALAAALDHDGLDYCGEVIVPNFSFIASATCALDRRLGVCFVDVDEQTLCLDPKRVEESIIPGKTRAIMAVHLFGQPADMTALRGIATRHNLKVIEDAAQAHGARWENGQAGSLGDAAAFSFQSSKNLNSGEGGLFVTNDDAIFERAYQMHDVGRNRVSPSRWAHESLGWNMRLNEYTAALLLDRMRDFEAEQERRAANFMALHQALQEVACAAPLAIHPGVRRHAAYMFVGRYFPEQCDNLGIDDFVEAVGREGVPIFRGYESTLSRQPVFQKTADKHPKLVRVLPSPVADAACRNTFYIPQQVFRATKADMLEIAAAFHKVQNHFAPTAKRSSCPVGVAASAVVTASDRNVAVTAERKVLRLGIVGFGAMGSTHAEAILSHPMVRLAAISDVRAETEQAARTLGSAWFATPEEMMRSGTIDGVVIATPHWQHSGIAIAALQQGLHVVCEKPMAVSMSEADAMLAAARDSRGLLSVVLQSRFEPTYRRAKSLLTSGELGKLLRCSMFEASWRSQSYYASSPWRGIWKGEGGGVLVNQAPHSLDRYVWLFGMPTSVSARCDALLHQIETEDSATALLRHKNGAHGTYHVSTNECPPTSRFDVMCERGRIEVTQGDMMLTRFRESLSEKTANDRTAFSSIAMEVREYPGSLSASHTPMLDLFYENLALAAAGEAHLICPGAEALHSVELANAMMLSSAENRTLDLPLERAMFDTFLKARIG